MRGSQGGRFSSPEQAERQNAEAVVDSELTRERGTGAPYPAGVHGLHVRWVRMGGLDARCVEAGDDQAPAIVMMPGWGCTAYTFRRNIPALVEGGWRVIVIEPPGQGQPRSMECTAL